MTSEVKEHGGYDYQFVYSPPDRVFCVICQFPSRNPHLTVCCGHVFCKSCLDQVKNQRSRSNNGCSMCRDKKFVTFPNKQIDREIKNLDVYCGNKKKGCRWSGKLNSFRDHLSRSGGCRFETVECPNHCGKALQRRNLPNHLENSCPRRTLVCEYCLAVHFANDAHLTKCPKVSIPCPNKCKVRGQVLDIPREEMDSHLDECPLEIIACEYHEVGCDSEFPRKDQSKHNKEKAEEHLALMQQDLSDTKGHLKLTEINLSNAKELLALTQKDLFNTKEELASAIGRIASLEVCLHQSVNINKSISDRRNAIVAGARYSIQLAALAATSSAGNQSVPVIMKICLKDCRDKAIYTTSFFTHNEGYKMRLLVYPYGQNNESHFAVYLCLMSGPFDDRLRWPLKQTFQIVLMNQISDDHHHSVTVPYNDITPSHCGARVTQTNPRNAWGMRSFITLVDCYKTTSTCQYFKDGCAFLKVVSLP